MSDDGWNDSGPELPTWLMVVLATVAIIILVTIFG